MKTTFPDLRTARARRRRFSPLALLAAFLLILLVAAASYWRASLADLFWSAAAPVIGVRTSAEAAVGTALASKDSLARELDGIRQELANTEARLSDRDALYRENLGLKERLGRSDAAADAVLAAVVMRPPGLPYDTLVIDIGRDGGVVSGDLVSAGGGALIGRIAEAYASASRVVLFSSPEQSLEGFLGGSMALSVRGEGSGALSAEVPSITETKPGDAVIIPGITAGVFAVVSGIEIEQGDSFKTLHMHLPVSLSSLRFVEVWRGTAPMPIEPIEIEQ